MKKNNIVLAIVLIAFVLCITIVIFVSLMNEREEEVTYVDLTLLKTNIDSETTFGETTMQDITKEMLYSTFGIEEDKVDEVIGKLPIINVHASTYVVLKAVEGNEEYIKQKFEEYGKRYEEQWEKYLPEQYDLVKRRKIGIKGSYVYFIVSDSAEEIVEMIK